MPLLKQICAEYKIEPSKLSGNPRFAICNKKYLALKDKKAALDKQLEKLSVFKTMYETENSELAKKYRETMKLLQSNLIKVERYINECKDEAAKSILPPLTFRFFNQYLESKNVPKKSKKIAPALPESTPQRKPLTINRSPGGGDALTQAQARGMGHR
jgi:soluble cytochrome b562